MHIIEEIKMDSTGRINISKLFDKAPKEVLVLYDDGEHAVYFRDDCGDEWAALQRKVDSKNRVVLPTWIRNKTGSVFHIVTDSKEKHRLMAKKPVS